ncbi:uncharacterized protein [Onthophagus taurus]|uniref:uncharacterized protein n=1 Tax=Onthophagus taurus TaxID=166361 RepID=UPI0039BE4C26
MMPSKKKKKTKSNNQEKKAMSVTDVSKDCSIVSFNKYFTHEEILTIRNTLKVKDLSGIPPMIGPAILNKVDLIGSILSDGHKINCTDQNNISPLTWAIKCKNLECIEALLVNGADATTKASNGDHVLFVALDNKIWDEQSFIFLWNNINNTTIVDSNIINRNGNSMLHMAVRREWTLFINILIERGANVDIINVTRITPLMLASFRNNIEIIEKLISSGANVSLEDKNGFIALCYALSSAITKQLQIPNLVVEKLLSELYKYAFSLEEYLEKRLMMIINSPNTTQCSGQTISGILLHIFTYVARYSGEGMRILLDLNVFQKIRMAAQKYIDVPDRLKIILSILLELLQHPECCQNPVVDELTLSDIFERSDYADVALEIMKKYENDKTCSWIVPLCFRSIMQACLVKGRCQEWLQNNYEDLQPYYEQIRIISIQNKTTDERTYNKMKKFEVLMNLLISGETICKKIIYGRNILQETEKNDDESKMFLKKTKRRTKALKAKIDKVKTAELRERLTSNRKYMEQLQDNQITQDFSWIDDSQQDFNLEESLRDFEMNQCDIVNSLKKNLLVGIEAEILCEKAKESMTLSSEDWKSHILNLPFSSRANSAYNPDYLKDPTYLKPDDFIIFSSENKSWPGNTLNDAIYPSLKYLEILLMKIINRYQKHWIIDNQLEKEADKNFCAREGFLSSDECLEQGTILQKLEQEKIDALRKEFDGLILYIKQVAAKDIKQCKILIKNVEYVLLSHEIRGTTIISEVCPMETVFVNINLPENIDLPCPDSTENAIVKYMEDVLNNRREPLDKIRINVLDQQLKFLTKNYLSDDILFMKEVITLPKSKPSESKINIEAQKKTLKNAYHMQQSILNVCDESDDEMGRFKEIDFNYDRISKTMMFFNKNAFSVRSDLIFNDTFVDPLRKPENEGETSRWCTLVRSLEMMEDCQIFLDGKVRISCKEKRQSHVISTGGNFTPVELGLDSCDRPLAVKRIPKGSCVCEMIRTMLVDLLDLRHKNLLHYFACDYDTNELIIATPLCEYNVGQYLMLMKQNQTNLSALDVVKEFLTGLLFLHNRVYPIVHGNLKPSNIFVDMNGVVKIAEFGIHRALFKFKEAPNSSIIWFATETYRTFKQLSTMECTSASDIQVAGMLIHFLMTAGKHPYGDDMRVILKNLDKAVPQLSAKNLELSDLITWMLLYEPVERPTIQQVVTHVYFWSPERKWRFILTCAGLGTRPSQPALKLEDLHLCLYRVAYKDNIKGKWVQVVKKQFPKISFSFNDDTPTGLLKFIRNCMESKDPLCFHTDLNLSSYILTAFPAFALSLYRMLENSMWVKHSMFTSFYSLDNIFT